MYVDLSVCRYSPLCSEGSPEHLNVLHFNQYYRFYSTWVDTSDIRGHILDSSYLVISVRINRLIEAFQFFLLKDLRMLLKAHGINPVKDGKMMNKTQSIQALSEHNCVRRCSELIYIFKLTTFPRKIKDVSDITDKAERTLEIIPNNTNEALIGSDAMGRDNGIQTEPSNLNSEVEVAHITNDEDDHLAVADDHKIAIIIDEWQREFSTERLREVICATCSKRVSVADSQWKECTPSTLNLLRNDLLPERLLPLSYNISAYNKALLNPKGLESTANPSRMRTCQKCFNSLSAGVTPKFALCNWLYYGNDVLPDDVRECFLSSSLLDRMLICRARCNSVTCKFNLQQAEDFGEGGQSLLNRERKGVRGNVMVAPLDVFRMNSAIPPASNSLRDTMCVIFVGDKIPSRSTISKYLPVLVRKSRVKKMIQFLMGNNVHYRPSDEFRFSEDNLNMLFEGTSDENLPDAVHIGSIPVDDAIESATSDYTYRNIDGDKTVTELEDDLLMENVGYTDGDDSPMNYEIMKTSAMERCLQGKPFIASGKGSQCIPDFNNPSILTWLFPHLDPWGIGGFFHPNRKIKIGMEEQLSHLLMIDDSPFQRDPEFAFVFYNICRKALVSQSLRFIVSRQQQRLVVGDLLKVDPEILTKLREEYQKNPQYRPVDGEEKLAFKLLSSLRMISRHVPGSDGYKAMRRNEIRALIMYRSTLTLLVTLNPSDVDHPIVRLFTGEDIVLEDLTRGEELSAWQRKILAARNPSACARFFDLMITKFIKVILRYGRDTSGLYGKCTAYYGTVEAQGKGTLHCHMLIWLEGHLSPQLLRNKMVESNEYRDKVFLWLESIIKCEFPGNLGIDGQQTTYPRRILHKETGDPHPGAINNPLVKLVDFIDDQFWREYKESLIRLIHQYSWHEHQATCWKYLERGQSKTDENCRLGMDGQLRESTSLDPETNAVLLRRHHPRIASYTEVVTFLMQCNMDIKFVGSGDAAKAFLYYVTDYITKPSLSVHVGMAALAYAVKRVNQKIPGGLQDCTEMQGVSAVTTAVNSMMGRQEISHPQVMSYLVGGGDHYKSDTFIILHWGAIHKYVLHEWEKHESTPDRCPNNQDNVTLTLGVKSIMASSQQLDYIYRSRLEPFSDLCLYDFVSMTSKVKFYKGKKDESECKGAFVEESDHPQMDTHYIRMRRLRAVPVLLGPKIGNPKKSKEMEEEWSRDIMILFKPWRDPLDLRMPGVSWSDAFHQYWGSGKLSVFHNQIINNMQVLTECNEARDSHPRGRRYRHLADIDDQCHVNDEASRNALPDDADESQRHCLLGIQPGNPFSNFDEDDLEIPRLRELLGGGISQLLDLCLPITMEDMLRSSNISVKTPSKITEREHTAVNEHSAVMAAKRKRKHRLDLGGDAITALVDSPSRNNVGLPISVKATIQDPMSAYSNQKRVSECIADGIVDEMGLSNNREQLSAFNIISRHMIDRSTEHLLMYVTGVGGTGKSHIIKSVVMLFERLNRRDELLLGAPTGIAAVLIGGQTLHSLLLIGLNSKSKGGVGLTAVWKRVKYLIVDEVSMLGAVFLSEMSSRMRQGKGDDFRNSEKPFGGVNVIFMGDFAQLQPPQQSSLYSHGLVKNLSFAQARNSDSVSALNGAFLWRQVTCIVELVKNQRHLEDPVYSAFLERLRLGECSKDHTQSSGVSDLEYIKSRLMENLASDPVLMASFKDAPIVVGSKALRDILNVKLVKYHARRLGQELTIYHSVDTISKKNATGHLQKVLWDLPSSINREAFGRLPLFIGMKVMVTENLAFENSVVNGSEGVVYDIRFDEDSHGHRHVKVVYVRIDGSGIQFENLPIDIVPIFPVITRIAYSSATGRKAFSRRQVPLVPAYVYTDFKSQGRTLTRMIADLATARGQGTYVMLSRVKSLSGLMILRWFPSNKIYHRLSEELRDEMGRLSMLKSESI